MDISTALMNNLKQTNPYALQALNQTTQMADMYHNIPGPDPSSSFLGSLGAGIAGAGPGVSTLQAMGQALPGAMQAMQQQQTANMDRQKQSLALRQTAANTLDAVRNYKAAQEWKKQEFGLKQREVATKERHNEVLDRHNQANEHISYLKNMQEKREKDPDASRYTQSIKDADEAGNHVKELQDPNFRKIVESPQSNPLFFPGMGGGDRRTDLEKANANLSPGNKLVSGSYERENMEKYTTHLVEKKIHHATRHMLTDLRSYSIPYNIGINIVNKYKPLIKEMIQKGETDTKIGIVTRKLLRTELGGGDNE